MNIVFNRETLMVSGIDREPFPYEIQVLNVDTTGLVKSTYATQGVQKTDAQGNGLYLLPQSDKQIVTSVQKKVTTTEVTTDPVVEIVYEKEPLLDANGVQVEYTPEPPLDENGEPIEEAPSPIKCFVMVAKDHHLQDEEGNYLYYTPVTEDVVTYESQPSLEITKDHPDYHEELEYVMHDTQVTTGQVAFEDEFTAFTYEDIISYKQKQLISGTFFSQARLYETMDESLFSLDLASFNAHLGYDFITIPKDGEIRTIKLTLPSSTDVVSVLTESNIPGIEVKIGALASDLQLLDRNKERVFDANVSEVYINFKNTTDKAVDLHSFAILV